MTGATSRAKGGRGRRPRLAAAVLAALSAGAPVAPPASASEIAPARTAQPCGTREDPCQAQGAFGAGDYLLVQPEGPGPFPTLMLLHGYGGQARQMLGAETEAERWLAAGWAILAPQAAPRRAGDAGGAWNSRGEADGRDDVAFLQAVLADAQARFPLDPGRVAAAGFSGGGMMVWRLACEAPETAAAYLPVAGLLWRPLPESCAAPVPLLHIHGWSDPVVPLEGRSVADGRLTQGDLFSGLSMWRRTADCPSDAPDSHAVRAAFQLREWTRCAPDAPLALALHPGGHRLPEGWASLAQDWLAARVEAFAPPKATPNASPNAPPNAPPGVPKEGVE